MDVADKYKLSIYHIGGRSGSRSFPILEMFERDVISVLFEADQSCIAGMREATAKLPSRTVILPDCLSGRAGPRPFHIYSNRYHSSLFKLLPGHANHFEYDAQFGWDADPGGNQLVETLTLDTVTLDQVRAREAARVPPPDFLSLDTQGSELEILQGAAGLLVGDVVAVMSEVEFVPVYRGQPLFGDIVAYMEGCGFALASLKVFDKSGASNRTNVGLRGRGFTSAGEALFLRRPEAMGGFADRDLSLLKLAFIAFVYGYFDTTYEILSGLPEDLLETLVSGPIEDVNYLGFLKAYAGIAGSYPPVFPVAYSDIVAPEQSAARFGGPDAAADTATLRRTYLNGRDEAEVQRWLSVLYTEGFIGVEDLAAQFKLDAQAEELRRRRREQMDGIFKWLAYAFAGGKPA